MPCKGCATGRIEPQHNCITLRRSSSEGSLRLVDYCWGCSCASWTLQAPSLAPRHRHGCRPAPGPSVLRPLLWGHNGSLISGEAIARGHELEAGAHRLAARLPRLAQAAPDGRRRLRRRLQRRCGRQQQHRRAGRRRHPPRGERRLGVRAALALEGADGVRHAEHRGDGDLARRQQQALGQPPPVAAALVELAPAQHEHRDDDVVAELEAHRVCEERVPESQAVLQPEAGSGAQRDPQPGRRHRLQAVRAEQPGHIRVVLGQQRVHARRAVEDVRASAEPGRTQCLE
mmetsp:Transcript_108683/g.304322  ORF Transcript_108683/g.304322 Transcript_108683/m.304322 type:complete len:287 (-) Transcript_108683:48-908(-)